MAADKHGVLANIFQNVYQDYPICYLNSSSDQPIGLRTLLTLGYCNRIIVGDPVPKYEIFPLELKYSPERDCHSLITEEGHLRLDRILPILAERRASFHYFKHCVKFALWGLEFYNEQNGSIISPEYEVVAALPFSYAYGMVDGERHSIYHVNFLARRVKNKTTPYPEIQLFFVELWGDKIINADDRGHAVRCCQILKPCLLNTSIGGVTTYAKGGIFHPVEVPCSTCHPNMYPWMEFSAGSPIYKLHH